MVGHWIDDTSVAVPETGLKTTFSMSCLRMDFIFYSAWLYLSLGWAGLFETTVAAVTGKKKHSEEYNIGKANFTEMARVSNTINQSTF